MSEDNHIWGTCPVDIPTKLGFDNNFEPFQKLLDSGEYLNKLEVKLKRLRVQGRNISAKDILKDLQACKEDHLLHANGDNSELTDEPDERIENNHSLLNDLEKVIFTRDISNPEELEELIKHDILAIVTARRMRESM